MMDEVRNRQIVVALAATTTDDEKIALSNWASQLLEIRSLPLPAVAKATRAIRLTANRAVLWPAMKLVAQELKKVGWSERSYAGRFGLAGATVGAAVFGGHGAGIAALGTAIGVPLWIVIGSGAAFAGVLIDEFNRARK